MSFLHPPDDALNVDPDLERVYQCIALSNPGDLRLIRFRLSHSNQAPIECTMQTTDFGRFRTSDTYEAISYVWGPPDLSRYLLVDDDSHLKI